MREKKKGSDLNTTARAVLALTANALFDARRSVPEETDWQQVVYDTLNLPKKSVRIP